MTGPSVRLDPLTDAFRRDLADVALAGRVIASHYAEPLDCMVTAAAMLRAGPADLSDAIAELERGEPFAMLDNSLGWAWGYAGTERRVGYLPSAAVGPA